MSDTFLNFGQVKEPKVFTEQEQVHINDTAEHVEYVRKGMELIISKLHRRAEVHDESKFREPELTAFAVYGAELSKVKYGTPEYFQALNRPEFKIGIDHHYANNTHHPEYHVNGIKDMSFLDILEMMADWKAAGMRTKDGSFEASLEYNRKRFNIPADIMNMMYKTAQELGWVN